MCACVCVYSPRFMYERIQEIGNILFQVLQNLVVFLKLLQTSYLNLGNSIPLDHNFFLQNINCSRYLFNKYLSNVYYVPGIFLGDMVIAVSKQKCRKDSVTQNIHTWVKQKNTQSKINVQQKKSVINAKEKENVNYGMRIKSNVVG